jgi:hypothetical protein
MRMSSKTVFPAEASDRWGEARTGCRRHELRNGKFVSASIGGAGGRKEAPDAMSSETLNRGWATRNPLLKYRLPVLPVQRRLPSKITANLEDWMSRLSYTLKRLWCVYLSAGLSLRGQTWRLFRRLPCSNNSERR